MSASHRAGALLLSLVSTAVLFVLFLLAIKIPALNNYAFQLDYGWQSPATVQSSGQCDRPLVSKGFPLTTQRPAKDDPSGCQDETNPLAKELNLALCFAAAAIISVGEASIIMNMRS